MVVLVVSNVAMTSTSYVLEIVEECKGVSSTGVNTTKGLTSAYVRVITLEGGTTSLFPSAAFAVSVWAEVELEYF